MSQPLLKPAPSGQALEAQGLPPDLTAAAARRQRYLLGVWIFVSVLTPLLGFLSARGFAPGVGLAGLLCLSTARPRREDLPAIAIVCLLALWACISALWSPAANVHGARGLKDITRFTGLHLAQQVALSGGFILATRSLAPETARRALTWFSWGLVALAVILVAEGFSDARAYQALQPVIGEHVRPDLAIRNVAQGGYVLAVLFWPAAMALQQEKRLWAAAVLAVSVAASSQLLRGAAPSLALAASFGVFLLALKGGRPAIRALGALAALQILVTPVAILLLADGGAFQAMRPHLPPSWAARVDIWSFTAARAAEKPLFGWGLDASRTFKGHIPLHPHDGALQLWFELGVPGAVLGALFWGLIFWRLAETADRRRLLAATGCATACVCMFIGAFSFSLWQEWWICLCALAFGAWMALGRRLEAPVRRRPGKEARG